MYEKQLKTWAAKSFAIMFAVISFSYGITKYNDARVYVWAQNLDPQQEFLSEQVPDQATTYRNIETGEEVEGIGDNYIRINKTSAPDAQVRVEDIYMERRLRIRIDNLSEKSYQKQAAVFSREETKVDEVSLEYEKNPNTDEYSAVFELTMDRVYVPTIYEDSEYIYIELKLPQEVYDKVIVVDAGHGGNDIGTASQGRQFVEKDINLSVVLELKKILDKDSTYKVYYTRLADEKIYLNPRQNLANEVEADLFLSVHCNGSEYIGASGTEGLYGSSKNRSGGITSKQFARICVEEVSKALNTRVRGVIKKEDIYIIGNSTVPVSLVELGFMSNEGDMKILRQKKYQKAAAKALYTAINRAFEEMDGGQK